MLPSNLLPQNSKAIVPVPLHLTLVTKGWFFNGTQAYKIASFVLPPQVGNVSIVAHRTYSDTERETQNMKPALPYRLDKGFPLVRRQIVRGCPTMNIETDGDTSPRLRFHQTPHSGRDA